MQGVVDEPKKGALVPPYPGIRLPAVQLQRQRPVGQGKNPGKQGPPLAVDSPADFVGPRQHGSVNAGIAIGENDRKPLAVGKLQAERSRALRSLHLVGYDRALLRFGPRCGQQSGHGRADDKTTPVHDGPPIPGP